MAKIYVVINRHRVKANAHLALCDRLPTVRVSRGKRGRPTYCDEVHFFGPCQILNGIGEPVMPCGATLCMVTGDAVALTTRGNTETWS